MLKVVLSICIPTYNRGKILFNNLNHLISFESDEIEIIVSDNDSKDDSEVLVKNIKDPRIKYFKNKKNLGFDRNLLKCCERANGMYYLFLSDEDTLDFKTLSWIIELLKKEKNITQILCSIGNLRPGEKKIYINPGNRILKSGHNALVELLFRNAYLSGIILRNDAIDLIHARNFIGVNYIHHILRAQAMLKGDTLCTSKIICYMGKIRGKSYAHSIQKDSDGNRILQFYHPFNRVNSFGFRLKLILDITKNKRKLRKSLLINERKWVARYLMNVLIRNPYWFFKIFPYFLNVNQYNTSIHFWKNLLFQFLKELKKFIMNRENFKKFIQVIKTPKIYHNF